MSKKVLFIAALLAPLCLTSLRAEQRVLSLEQVLQLVEQNNKDVATARKNTLVSQQGVKEANASKLPDIQASLNLTYNGDATLLDRDFSNITRAEVPHFGNGLELTLYQPVYAGGAITAGVKLSEAQSRMSANQLETVRQQSSISAVGCFLELYKANNLRNVYDENITITEQLLTDMKARFNEGVVLKNDITRYELRLSCLTYDRLVLTNRIDVMNRDLCRLLGLPTDTEITASLDSELRALPSVASKEYWNDTALTNSTSLHALDIRSEINDQQTALAKADYLPKIGIIAGNSFNGPITFEIPPIDKNFNYWYVGVNISYNFASLYKTPKTTKKLFLEREEIDNSREALKEHINSAIDDTYTNYTQAYSMLETEEKNVELATENYRLVENRYNNQLALLTDMLDASTAKLDAEVRLVNAQVNIIYYYYQLKYNSGTL
jgi:outer membrane protein TolC